MLSTYPPEIYYLVHPNALQQFLDACFQDPGHNHSVLALVNAAFALGAQASGLTDEDEIPGMDFFQRVKLLLATVTEENNIISIQTLNILVRQVIKFFNSRHYSSLERIEEMQLTSMC